jgi:hypothetical protein
MPLDTKPRNQLRSDWTRDGAEKRSIAYVLEGRKSRSLRLRLLIMRSRWSLLGSLFGGASTGGAGAYLRKQRNRTKMLEESSAEIKEKNSRKFEKSCQFSICAIVLKIVRLFKNYCRKHSKHNYN